MHVSQYISCINMSFPNNETTKHSLQASLSSSESINENWKNNRKLKIEQKKNWQLQNVRDECYLSRCRDKQVRCLPKTPVTDPRRTGGKKTRKTVISFMHCPIIIIHWEKKIFRHLQLSVVFFLFFLNCQWLNFLWWSHSLSLGKKCNLGLWLEWHLTL